MSRTTSHQLDPKPWSKDPRSETTNSVRTSSTNALNATQNSATSYTMSKITSTGLTHDWGFRFLKTTPFAGAPGSSGRANRASGKFPRPPSHL
ncbi:hypothetical protein N7501_005820 [Penicillium viridicatum]|nr:hypothetical protein N7501_005820 [Penicillium viridicatum]